MTQREKAKEVYMMSIVPIVESILEENANQRRSDLKEIQNRCNDLVKRGIIQEERPKTFGSIPYPIDYKNRYINYPLL